MPKKPTGRPRGRPQGSGLLGEQARLTVRIPLALFQRLEAFAERNRYTRGAPQLAVCVREALELYLDDNRQTKNSPASDYDISGQTINNPIMPDVAPEPARGEIRQTINTPAKVDEDLGVVPTPKAEPVHEEAAGRVEPLEVPQPTFTVIEEVASSGEAPAPQRQRGLSPSKLKEILDERTRHEDLSLREFAQHLFDRNIYKAKARDGSEIPVNSGTLGRWLEQARAGANPDQGRPA